MLEMRDGCFYKEGKPILLLCGELHYFRMPRKSWERALDNLVAAGCNAVAYYVPWFVHEYEEGVFDFSGSAHPCNDLHAWIALTQKKGLIGFLRPGPYVYAECTDLGIPGWFLKRHPDAKVKKYENGRYVNANSLNAAGHNHPEFLAATARWYAAVCGEMLPYLMPRGNIAMVQLCNEIPGDDNDDHNPENLGVGSPEGRYPRYLRETYGTREMLSARYGAQMPELEFVEPHMLEAAAPALAKLDRLSFYYRWYYPAYFEALRGMMRAGGVESLFIHNAYNPRAVSLDTEKANTPGQPPWYPKAWLACNLTGEENYVILDAEGCGKYVGCNLNIDVFECQTNNWYGEGDDMIFIDGDPLPTLAGTGTEDFFNTAFCPSQEFCAPFHGIMHHSGTAQDPYGGKNSMYRLHIADPIHFETSIRVTIEHGHNNKLANDYSSTAYWYQTEPHKPFGTIGTVADRLPRPDRQEDTTDGNAP